MTSDAKIGLLLGLVFIFITAFVVTGLPRLRSEPDSNELTIISAENVVSSETIMPGLGARERNAEGVFDRTWTPPEQEVQADSQQPAARRHRTNGPVAQQEAGVRYQASLPQGLPASTDELLSFGPRGRISFEPSWLVNGERSTLQTSDSGGLLEKFLGAAQTSKGPQAAAANPPKRRQTDRSREQQDIPKPRPAKPEESTPTLVRSENPEPERLRITTPKPLKQRSNWPKEYVVSSGDNLAIIAKKFYGAEEGNVRANIDLIFKANGKTLESPDKIKVGQKLKIPALPGAKVEQDATVFPKSLVERVRAMGPAKAPAKKSVAAPGRFYVAKDGDSLWKIAAGQLGKGHRYVEIFELNSDIMKDAVNVVPGMHLRMPAN